MKWNVLTGWLFRIGLTDINDEVVRRVVTYRGFHSPRHDSAAHPAQKMSISRQLLR